MSNPEKKALIKAENHDQELAFLLCALFEAEGGEAQRANPTCATKPGQIPFLGGEFGVRWLYAPTFYQQLVVARRGILQYEDQYERERQADARTHKGFKQDFVESFGQRWCRTNECLKNDKAYGRILWELYQKEKSLPVRPQ